ncbi:hypothetical protein D9M68_874400 [compost metagenome]
MSVAQESETAAQHEDGGKQVPLDFQQRVGAGVEELANDGVARADERGGQDEPHHELADQIAHGVDQARDFQQN